MPHSDPEVRRAYHRAYRRKLRGHEAAYSRLVTCAQCDVVFAAARRRSVYLCSAQCRRREQLQRQRRWEESNKPHVTILRRRSAARRRFAAVMRGKSGDYRAVVSALWHWRSYLQHGRLNPYVSIDIFDAGVADDHV